LKNASITIKITGKHFILTIGLSRFMAATDLCAEIMKSNIQLEEGMEKNLLSIQFSFWMINLWTCKETLLNAFRRLQAESERET